MTADAGTQVGSEAEAFVRRLLEAALGMGDILSAYVGERLGLYRALAEEGSATSGELAARTHTHERYVREWLEQQAAGGIVAVAAAHDEGMQRRYTLPEAHREVLLEPASLNYFAPLTRAMTGCAAQVPALLEAFRSGGGIDYGAYGPDVIEAQAALNRPAFEQLLPTEWLPAIADVDARLRTDPPARVADIGCGAAWSAIAIARAYPGVEVDGFDLDPASVALAAANIDAAGLGERVRVRCQDAGDPALAGRYDLVTAFETIHDMSRPVEALSTMRRLAGEHGAVLVVDERVGESFSAPADPIERFFYAASLFLCLPSGMADAPSAGTGTVMRPAILEGYARAAGFGEVEILPIEYPFFRFYRLRG